MVKDALRIAELEKLLAERTADVIQMSEQLSVINSVQEALVKEMDLQAIYDLVGNRIQELFDAQVVGISTFELEDGTEKFQYIVEKGERFYPEPRPLGKLRLHLLETGKKIIINNRQEGEAWFGTEVIPGTEPIKSAVFVPLVIGDKITSYITLQNIDKENAFSDSEIRLLETLANSMSTALENARLLKETEQRTAELAVINSVQEGLAKELDIQAIYDLVGNRIRELFDAQVVGIATFDHEKETENLQYLIEKGERYYPTPKPINTLRKHLIQSKEKIVINKNFSAVAEAFGMKPVPGTQYPKSAVYVPLVIGDKVTGYTSLQNIDKENAFSESDIRLLETLANSMGVALENARLFDETTRLLKETEQQKAELGVINSVQEGLAKELNMQAIYDLVGDRIRDLFNAQAVIISTFDHETATEHFKYLIEDGQRFYLPPRPYDKLRQHMIITRQKFVYNTNYEEVYAKFGLKTLPGTNPTKSGVYVPLIIGEKVNSYISLQAVAENAFSESDVRLLETLANSMSVALENARLFDETTRLLKETEQRTAELAVINSVQEGLARELDMNAIYDLVGNKIRDVFDAQAVVIATFEHETGTEKFNFLFEKGERYFAEPRRYDKLRYQLIMSKQKILINDNVEEAFKEFGLKVVQGTEMPKSLLYVPLVVGNKVTSYVSLQNVDKNNAFSDADVRLLETLANSMSVALENARLFDETNRLLKETEQGKAELAVINSVQEGLVREMNIQGIYNLVGDRIQKLFTAQVAIIATFDHERRLEHFNYHFEKGEISHPDPRRFDKVRQHLIETGQNILINSDYPKAAAEYGMKVVPGTEAPKSLLFMPLKVGDKVNGYVSLQNIDEENAFSFSDVRLLSTLANSMSVALENARLFDETTRLLKETEQRTAELSVINSVQGGLAKEIDMHGIYELVGEKIREIFDAQVIDIVTYDSKTNLLEDRYAYEKGDRTLVGTFEPKGFRKYVVDSGQLLLINKDLDLKSIEFNAKVLHGELPKSAVFVPMISSGNLTGMISLQNLDKEHAFSDSNVNLLTTLANSMSIALESARRFDETNRLLKETEQRNAELAVINSVQESLVAKMDMQGIYELVGEKIREIFDAQVIDIVMYNSSSNLLEDRYSYEKGDRSILPAREPKGFRKHVIQSKQLLLHNENVEQAMRDYNNEILIGEKPKSQVYVPMIAGGEVKGIISLQNLDHEHAFSDSDISLITTLANSMSVALESARLFDETTRLLKETEQRTAELAVINSVQEGLARELDIHGIYKLVGDRMCNLFPDTQTLVIRTFNHEAGEEYFEYFIEKGVDMKVDPRPFMWANKQLIQSKQALLIHENYVETAKKYGGTGVTKGDPPKSAVFVPMIVGDIVKGSVSLQNVDRENAFTDSDLRLLTTLTNSMSVALENARLFDETTRLLKETEQRTAELSVINSVQEGLATELNIQSIYELVGEKMREIFSAQVIDIVTYDSSTDIMEDRYSFEKGDRTLSGTWKPTGFRKHVIESGHLLVINEKLEEKSVEFNSPVLHGEQPKSVVFVPLISGNEVKGMISLQNLDHEHAFSDSDVNLLTTLANSMTVALESARLFDETSRLLKETEQRNAELAVINSVQESLVAKMDIQGIYELVGEKFREIFDAQVIDIVTYDPIANVIEDRYAYEKGDRTMLGPRPVKGFRRHVIKTKQILLHNQNVEQAMKDFNNEILIGEMPKSQVYVPMIAGGEVKGIISLQNVDHEFAFSESDVNLLTTLANSMSVALESARLFDETTRLLKETELRTAELSVINSVQEGLAKVLSIQGIYELVGEKIRTIFNAQVIDIITYDRKSKLIEDRYAFEKGDRSLLGPRIPTGFRKHVIETNQPLVINQDIEKHMLKYGNVVMHGEPSKSVVFVPMIAGGELTGIISLQNIDQENAFSDSEVSLLKTLANSMTVALESARLFAETTRLLSETEQRTSELSVINSVQDGLARELDISGIYDLVGEKMREIFNAQVIDIVSYDKNTNMIEDCYTYEKGDRTLLGPRPLKGFRKHVIETTKPLVINKDVYQERSKYDQSVIVGEGAKSIVLVPMIASGEVTGVISLQNLDQENAFSDAEVNLLNTLSNSMSVALESARLFDETTRLLKETEQRTAELAVINSVQEGLAKELDIQGIYDLVGERIIKVFNAPNLVIRTFDLETGKENWRYAIEKGERQYIEPKPFVWHSKRLMQTQKPIHINENYLETSKKFGGTGVFVGQPTKSGIFVPMVVGGVVKGSVSLQNVDKEFAYNEADLRLLTTITNSMSVALENARLFDETNRLLKETEQRTAELAVINSVQDGLAKELDMEGIYNLVGDRVQHLFNAQVVLISTFDLPNKTEYFNYFFENNEKVKAESRPINNLRQLLIDKKHTIYIATDEQATNEYGLTAIAGTKMTKSLLFVPMLTGNVIRGYVSLQNIDTEYAFSDSDIRLLETIANSMSVALENARLFDETNRLLKETEQRKAELAVINSVQEGLVREMDMQAIYDLVGNRLYELFNTTNLVIRTFDHDTGKEHWRYANEKGQRQYIDPKPFIWANRQLIQTKKPIHINENYVETSKKYGGTGVSIGQPPKSAVFVPMIVGDIVKGSVSLQNVDNENAYTETDLRLLTTLTNSMSVALENARLFDETNRLLKETEQRTAELAIINSVQEGLASKLEIQSIYDLVGDKIRDVFDTQGISISFYDRQKNFITHPYYLFKGERIEYLGFELGKGLVSHIIQTAQPLLINSNAVERFKELGAVYASNETEEDTAKSWLGVPLISGGLVNGTIRLENYEREFAYTESDVSLLQTLANSMSVALENARLFDETSRLLKETEQRTAELAVINSVQEGLAKELDMQGIYDLIGDRLCELFPDTQTLVIRTFDHESGFERWQYAKEKGVRQNVDPRPLNWNSKELILTKKPLDIKENYVETSKKHGGTGVTAGQPPKSAVFVPMLVGDLVRGSVSLQNVDKENAFTDSDLRLLTTITNSMSVALENARLFDETNRLLKETEQRTAELAVINSVQEGLAKELDLQGIYDLVGDRLCELFPDIQTLVIRTFDHATSMENFHYAIEKGERFPIESRPFIWATKHLIKDHKPIYINENYIETSKKFGGTGVTKGKPPKSAVFVPMLVGDLVKGSVSLQNVDKENAFTDADLRLLTTITNSMSVALENARLFDETNRLLKETEQRTAELAVINSVQDGLVREMDINAIYELVGERLCNLFNTQTVLIRTFDHQSELENWRYVIEKGERHYSEPRPLIWANKHLVEQRKALLINENYLETAKKYGGSGVSMGSPPKSAVFVPMIVGDVVKGSVSLQNVEMEHAFSDSDLRLLTTITNSMSVALENARLFDETTLLLAESKQRAAELSTVNSISKALASQLDPDDLIKMVGDQLKDLFKANIVYLAILNKKTNVIHFPYQNGDTMEPIKMGEGLTSKIILTGEPILINKDLKELRKQMGIESIGVEAASYLGVPIPVGDENIGVLSVQSTEHENRFKENDLRLLSTIASSVGVALRNATLFEDVQQAKMEAEAASKLAEKANEAKSAFLSTVSHELRTPLTSVLGFAKIIKKRLEERIFPIVDRSDSKIDKAITQVSENLHVVISEGTRLTHLINDVLDLAKIEAGKMEFAQENVSMSDVAERALAATTSLFEQKNLKLIRKIDTDLPDVIGDSDKLIQVMINLISNSVKFTDEGSITCSVRKVKNEIVASITDTGIGIALEDFGAVFEQFKQVGGDTLTDKPKGTGLGLPICKEIVEHLGGRIWLESKVGKGSIFSFALPIEKQESAERPIHLDDLVKQLKEQVANSQLNLIGKASTILIVDDDESIRSLLHQELGDAGYQITEAANGKEALDCVRKHRPDLIILDIMMPEMNGFDVAAVLKNDPNTMDIPIIVLSVVQDKARGFRIGVDRYLTKPIDTGLLFSEIGSLLEHGHPKKKVMIVDEDSSAVNALSEVLKAKGYEVSESKEKELVVKAKANLPDIIIINSVLSGKQDIVQTLRFEKGLENVLFLVYQ